MNRRTFTAGDVETLLREAKAPEPWRDASHCQEVAELLNDISDLRQGLPDLESRTGPFLKARAAAIPLQKTLPTLIAWELAVLDVPPLLDGPRSGEEATKWRQGQSERVARLKLLSSLLEIVFPSDRDPPSIGILGNYPFAARLLLIGYRAIVGQGKPHKNSPAMRFVVSALKAVGHHEITTAAAAKALRTLGLGSS
jgi:hypothetical protein